MPGGIVEIRSDEDVRAALSNGARNWEKDELGHFWLCPICTHKERVKVYSCSNCGHRPIANDDIE